MHGSMYRNFSIPVHIFLVVSLTSSCALMNLSKDVQFSKESCLILGEISSNSPQKKSIIVIAYSEENTKVSIEDYAMLSGPGPYELLVRDGRYRIFSFEDANDNLSCDSGEWSAYYNGSELVSSQPGGMLWGLDIVLSRTPDEPAPLLAHSLLLHSKGTRKPFRTAGAIADLDDPAFSAERGKEGFWEPLKIFRLTGANIYFLEPYDRDKIPVLLVHGAAGSPQDWRYFIKSMDRVRYQPWIFQYPSGARLSTMTFMLRKKLYDLYMKYDFERIYIVAHSMGGLICRSALIESDRHNQAVKLFISISTPWGGEPRATTGVKYSPAVIPSWKDMEPDSDFIRSIFAKELPDTLRYYLLFSHRGGGNPLRPNNDNTVLLESMLDQRAQQDTLKVLGFNEDHISILNSPVVIDHYRAIVKATEAGRAKTISDRRGYVDVRHAFVPSDTRKPLHIALILIPADGNGKETQINLNPALDSQETGAVKPGKYEASVCALGFMTEPATVPLVIRAGKITESSFFLRPQGMVAGIIIASTIMKDSYWGYFRELPEGVIIRAIRLSGPGVSRELCPEKEMTDRESLKTFLASRDYASKNYFAFFDLAAGDYTLSIEADGCEPFSTMVTVKPGEFIPPPPYRLKLK